MGFPKSVVAAMKDRKVIGLKYRDGYPLIVLEGGFEIVVMSDEEGNSGGVLSVDACPAQFARAEGLLSGREEEEVEPDEPPPQKVEKPKTPSKPKKHKEIKPEGSRHPENSQVESTATISKVITYENGFPSRIIFPRKLDSES